MELVTRVYKFGGGWNRKLLSTDKNLANHEHENAIILDECVYSNVWAAIRTNHARIIIHQMKCTGGLSHKHLKEPNQSNLSGRRPMPWIQVFGAQDSTLKGVPHFSSCKGFLMHVLHTMFSQLLDLLLPLLTLLILKHLKIRENWFYWWSKQIYFKLFFPFFEQCGVQRFFFFKFFDGASQSGNHPHKMDIRP